MAAPPSGVDKGPDQGHPELVEDRRVGTPERAWRWWRCGADDECTHRVYAIERPDPCEEHPDKSMEPS